MKSNFLVLLGCIFCLMGHTQIKRDNHCATMEMDSLSRRRFPERGTILDFEDAVQHKLSELRKIRKGGRIMAEEVTIPVIVHVVHNGEAVGSGTNISAAQVQAQIEVLNEDFRKMIGTPGGESSNPLAADIEINFCLSPVDENGNLLAEPGIHRYHGGRSDWSLTLIETDLKPNSIWNPNQFLNLWTVKFAAVNSTLLGYAQFPDQSGLQGLSESGGSAATDGVVVRYQSFGSVDKGTFPVMQAPYNKGRTLTHEVGHWLGLRHIWGDGNCANDYVADTPSQASPSSGCPTGRITCGGVNMVENYMDYSNDACMNIFTEGQKERMRAVIDVSPRRKTLIDNNTCGPVVSAPPQANFGVSNANCILLGSKVFFTDLSKNIPTQWTWTFEGGEPANSTDRNPSIVYNSPGTYDVTLVVKNALGESDITFTDLIVVSEEGICRSFNNFNSEDDTPALVKMSGYGNFKGYLAGHNSTKSTAVSEFFSNSCGYLWVSGANVRFGKVYTQNLTATAHLVVWNARGAQFGPGSVIERKEVLLKQIQEDIAANKPTEILFGRETPIFGKPFHVGIEFTYNGDTVAIRSSADGESSTLSSWIKKKDETWVQMAIEYGANIAMDIQPLVGMNPSVQVAVSDQIVYPGQQVTLNGRGASVFAWDASDGSVTNFPGPQLIVNPTETTTYTATGSGLDLCNGEGSATIFVSDAITEAAHYIPGILAYPNPGNDIIHMEWVSSFQGTVYITLSDLTGRMLGEVQVEKTEGHFDDEFDSSAMPQGSYILMVKEGGVVRRTRWVKQ